MWLALPGPLASGATETVSSTLPDGGFVAALKDRRAMAWLACSTVLIAINWTVYVGAVTSGRALDASLGSRHRAALTDLEPAAGRPGAELCRIAP